MFDDPITEFSGEYAFLSNFWPVCIVYEDEVYQSIENAYQAAKSPKGQRHIYMICQPSTAKILGRKVVLPKDWNLNKTKIMGSLIKQKFRKDTEFAKRLLGTGDALLVEGNTWGDTFWGMCNNRGKNFLGLMLMAQREALRVELNKDTLNKPEHNL